MYKNLLFLVLPVILSLTAPCEDTYIIEIPRTVDISETQSFQINIIENDLSGDQILHIDMPDQFTLTDSCGSDDVSGALTGNHITYEAGDISSRTVTIETSPLTAGEWSCQLPISIHIEEVIPSNILIAGPDLNQILSQIEPVQIIFSHETVAGNAYCDISLAQDGSILLYVDGDEVIISNASQDPIIANQDMSLTFSSLSSLESISGMELLDLSSCSDISGMFGHDRMLNNISNISGLDTSSIRDMSYLFQDTALLTSLDLNTWNMSSVQDISHMFESSAVTSLNIGSWNTGNVTDMSYLFHDCTQIANIRIANWDTSSVEDMTSMFEYCTKLKTLSLAGFDVSSCTSFRNMFAYCSVLTSTGDLDSWDVSHCLDMSGMFQSGSKLRNIGDISSWQTEAVTDMSYVFYNCIKLASPGDLSSWDVGNVRSFSHMFANTAEMTVRGDIFRWNVSDECTDLSYMFQNCASTLPSSLDLSGWDVSSVSDISHMFENSRTLTRLDISGWDCQSLENAASTFAFYETGGLSPLEQITGIDQLDVSSLKNISYIFYEDQYLNCDLSQWNTQSLEDISYAFYGTYRFDVDKLKHWNVSSVSDMTEAFGDNAGLLIQSPVPDWYH